MNFIHILQLLISNGLMQQTPRDKTADHMARTTGSICDTICKKKKVLSFINLRSMKLNPYSVAWL
ncbi:Uncharacterized protein APZ42_034468 [Daphnia magna]|uniref:Uncharacterized protein n=1 Tax=Daphnia magna TaxID=35525 RepID=A0A164K6M4_9CRUS|nr:Uncharacterized protein APZ42_034468 [Daphnia magna]